MKTILSTINVHKLLGEKIHLTDEFVKLYHLSNKEKVAIYKENYEVEGIVEEEKGDGKGSRWNICILSKKCIVSTSSRCQGREEGYINGKELGKLLSKIKVAEILIKDGISIEVIKRITELPSKKLMYMKKIQKKETIGNVEDDTD